MGQTYQSCDHRIGAGSEMVLGLIIKHYFDVEQHATSGGMVMTMQGVEVTKSHECHALRASDMKCKLNLHDDNIVVSYLMPGSPG